MEIITNNQNITIIVLKKSPKITKVISEYEDNFNSLARYWKREELLTKSEVYVSRKHTLPQE